MNKIFIRVDGFPQESNIVKFGAMLESHLGGLSNHDLREIYLYCKYPLLDHSEESSSLEVILGHCRSLLPAANSELTILAPFDLPSLGFIEMKYPHSRYCYLRPKYLRGYAKNRSEEYDYFDIIVTMEPRNIGRCPLYLEFGKVSQSDIDGAWSEEVSQVYEYLLKIHEIYFYQKGDDLLRLIKRCKYADDRGQYIHMVYIDEKNIEHDRPIPIGKLKSLAPIVYYQDHSFDTVPERLNYVMKSIVTLRETYPTEGNGRYCLAWNIDYMKKRFQIYLDGFQENGLLDEWGQSSKPCVMYAIAAALSFRMKLFKYERTDKDKIPLVTSDFSGFISGNKDWRPGHVIVDDSERSVSYIWNLWNDIFVFPSKKENQIRQRVHDNMLSRSLRRRIAKVMRDAERNTRMTENAQIFPIDQFPDFDIPEQENLAMGRKRNSQ